MAFYTDLYLKLLDLCMRNETVLRWQRALCLWWGCVEKKRVRECRCFCASAAIPLRFGFAFAPSTQAPLPKRNKKDSTSHVYTTEPLAAAQLHDQVLKFKRGHAAYEARAILICAHIFLRGFGCSKLTFGGGDKRRIRRNDSREREGRSKRRPGRRGSNQNHDEGRIDYAHKRGCAHAHSHWKRK